MFTKVIYCSCHGVMTSPTSPT